MSYVPVQLFSHGMPVQPLAHGAPDRVSFAPLQPSLFKYHDAVSFSACAVSVIALKDGNLLLLTSMCPLLVWQLPP